jgi:ornithine carbamoyltransferase
MLPTISIAPAAAPDLLRAADLDAAQLEWLLDMAAAMKAHPAGFHRAREGETVVCLFEKPSTRTRVSFVAAAARLGITALVLRPDELQLGRGETIEDTGRVLSRYAAAIVVRTFAQATLESLAAAADVPVINALSDEHHPCQALADLLTLHERFGHLRGLHVVFAGDGGSNVCHSLLEAGALAGVNVTVACPPDHAPDEAVLARVEELGGTARVTADIEGAVAGADAVYTDVWVSMGQDADRDARLSALEPYRVTAGLMNTTAEEPLNAVTQRRNGHAAAQALACIADEHELVITHGNGPQVGLLAETSDPVAWPLDVLGAEREGMIGYVLEQELRSALPWREVATLLTQTVVDADDPAFGRPTKPVGPVHPASEEAVLAAAMLARAIGADALLLLTDVAGVLDDPAAASPTVLRSATPGHLHALGLPAGSMGPKAEAAARFAAGGGTAAIGALEDAVAVLAGDAGTQVFAPPPVAPTPSWTPF